jgi:hypothetical protein
VNMDTTVLPSMMKSNGEMIQLCNKLLFVVNSDEFVPYKIAVIEPSQLKLASGLRVTSYFACITERPLTKH